MKRKSGRRSQKAAEAENGLDNKQNGDADDEVEEKESPKKKQRKSGGAKGKKSKRAKEDKEQVESEAEASKEESDPLAQDEDMEYEVESILEEKRIKGVRHYLIRWKGYTEESDTWEPEDTLDCADLIKDFNSKNKKKKKDPKRKKGEGDDWDENQDFEVDRILDVYFHKNGKRDFLVSWKGYPASQNSWEPEDNMDCKDLIAKYMAKVETAKQYDDKELRVNRKRVNRLDLAMHVNARRLSKRRTGKERVHYFDAE